MKIVWKKIVIAALIILLPWLLAAGKNRTLAAEEITCDANSNGITVSNNTDQAKTINYNFLAKYCETNSGCFCSGGPIYKDNVVIGAHQTISEGFINQRPACNWSWQTDITVTSSITCHDADHGCGSASCVTPTPTIAPRPTATPTPRPAACNSLTASPVNFQVGETVNLSCNVTSGTGPNAVYGYALAYYLNGLSGTKVRNPSSGWQTTGNTWSLRPVTGYSYWCGAQTIDGAIVGGENTACTARTCQVGGRQANYGQTGAGFTVTPLNQAVNASNWPKTWKITGNPGATANVVVMTYICQGAKRSATGYDLCPAERATSTIRHSVSVMIPTSGNTTFTVYDPVGCCMLGQSDILSVNGSRWGSSFFLRWAEAAWCS